MLLYVCAKNAIKVYKVQQQDAPQELQKKKTKFKDIFSSECKRTDTLLTRSSLLFDYVITFIFDSPPAAAVFTLSPSLLPAALPQLFSNILRYVKMLQLVLLLLYTSWL